MFRAARTKADGVVTVGTTSTASIGDARYGWFDDIPRSPNSVGSIHTHPFDESGPFSYDWNNNPNHVNGRISAGPSGADMGHALTYNVPIGNYRSVVVDKSHVYLYRDTGTPVITISRNKN